MQLAGLVAAVHELVIAHKRMPRYHCYYLPLKPERTASQHQRHRARNAHSLGAAASTVWEQQQSVTQR